MMGRRPRDPLPFSPRLTREHILSAFPTMYVLAREVSTEAFLRLLTAELGAFTDNLHYAQTVANAIMSHVEDGLLCELPRHWIPYRAIVDEFCSEMRPGTERSYVRAIAKSLGSRCTPAAFRRALQGRANEHRLQVPEFLFYTWKFNDFSVQVKFRCPLSIVGAIKTRAQAAGTNSAEWIRQAIYERIYNDDH